MRHFVSPCELEMRIARQWDLNVEARASELTRELDGTYRDILLPTMLSLFRHIKRPIRVLDFGCGLGFLTNEIFKLGVDVTGVDMSEASIRFARARFSKIPFICNRLEDYSSSATVQQFSAVVANMVFHNIFDLRRNLECVARLLELHGFLIASVPMPSVWIERRRQSCIELSSPDFLEMPFKIRNGVTHPSKFTFFERSYDDYVLLLRSAGFKSIWSYQSHDTEGLPDDLLFFVATKESIAQFGGRYPL